MRKLFTFIFALSLCLAGFKANAVTIYLNPGTADASGIAVYVWGNATSGELFGGWPGKVLNTCNTTVKNGTTYYVLEVASGNVIFNNNGAGQQVDFKNTQYCQTYSEVYVDYPYNGSYKAFNVTSESESGTELPPAELYLVGVFNSWTTGDTNYHFTRNASTGIYTLNNVTLSSATEFKFVDSYSTWYGTEGGKMEVTPPASDITIVEGGTDNNFQIKAGTYSFTVDIENHTFSLAGAIDENAAPTVYLTGEFSEWGESDSFKFTYSEETKLHTLNDVSLSALAEWEEGIPNFKLIVDGAWLSSDTQLSEENNSVTLEDVVPNIRIPEGTYSFTYDAASKLLTVTGFGEATVAEIYLTGEFSEWGASDDYKFAYDSENNVYTLNNIALEALAEWEAGVPNFKIIDNGTWYGYNGKITEENNVVTLTTGDTPNATIDAGTYSFTYSRVNKQLTVTGFGGSSKSGDVNGDGDVDVSDVVALANYVMGSTPEEFVPEAADINGVDGIDIADVVALAGMVMGN
ncbi:MAG: starch-binding protein [Muribaculaceae bacterium]|nr:starch-binding protein [Muribaculaceae bacterium]